MFIVRTKTIRIIARRFLIGFHTDLVIAIDRAAFNQGQNAQYDFSIQEDVAQTIVAKGPGGGVLAKQLEHYAQETTKE